MKTIQNSFEGLHLKYILTQNLHNEQDVAQVNIGLNSVFFRL